MGTPLAFGTSGLRGLVTDITDREAYVNVRGFLAYLRELGELDAGAIALAGDLRPSTDSPERSILRAVARAVTDAGVKPLYCGRIPTPALAAYAFANRMPSIMVTGSHIPFDRNGIKFNRRAGEVLKSDEAPILRLVERARAEVAQAGSQGSIFDEAGMFRDPSGNGLPDAIDAAREHYLRRYTGFLAPGALAGLRVAVYEHSAVGRDILKEALAALGAEVCGLARSDTFVPIDTEALGADRLRELQVLADRAREHLGRVDAVVSTDGDSDRPLVLAVDATGRARFVSGDVLGMLVAEYLKADAVIVPITATDAIELHFAPLGVTCLRTRVGSPWVIAGAADAVGQRKVGWEANGGFLAISELELDGRRLSALPTRDALLPILSVLHAAKREGQPLHELVRRLPPRFSAAGLIDDVPVEQGRALFRRLVPDDSSMTEVSFGEGGVESLNPSSELRLGEIRSTVARHFDAARGFGAVASMNFIDGVRIRFAGGDVAHLRASGNAPQLRIYACAATPERAQEIVALALAEPQGILRSLLQG